jgi:uncharacterized repeat protein (TIGR01451 family)
MTGSLTLDANSMNPGILDFAASAGANGIRLLSWDGNDNDATALAATGLGGIDLTNGGQDLGVGLTIGADQANGAVTLRVYSSAVNFSTASAPIPVTLGGTASDAVLLRFMNFATGGGTGADFTNVGAIEVLIEGTAAVDGQLDLVGALGPTETIQNFANFEEIDLAVTKSVDNASPNVGANVTFMIAINNVGPDDGTNVAVSDTLPAGMTFVSSTSSVGTYDSNSGIWTIGNFANGASATLQITASVDTIGTKTNTAQVSSADQFDTDSTVNNNISTEDDQDEAAVTPQVADLSLTKSVSNSTPNVGDNMTFSVTVTNGGPNDATGVAVGDILPAGVTFVSSTPSQGTYVAGTGVWTVGALATGASASLQIEASVDTTGTKTNTAQVTGADQADSDSTPNNNVPTEDDQDNAAVTPRVSDLSITKVVDNATPNLGENVNFTITITNDGPDDASNVTVGDVLPAGTTFVSATLSAGTYDNITGVWTVGSLANGTNATLQIVASVDTTGTKTNTAQVTGASETDIDSTPNNNVVSEDDQDDAAVTPQVIDLSLTKAVDNSTPNVGANVTFTLTLSNAGPDAATNVTVSDTLPAGLGFVSSTPSAGTYDNGTGIWTVGTVNSGANATLQIIAPVDNSGTKTNTAQVASVDQSDSDSTPNNNVAAEDDQDDAALTPLNIDLELTKTVNSATPNLNVNVTFTVSLVNQGPGDATNVTVLDSLPAGLTFVSATSAQGTYDNGTGVWTVGSLSNGATTTLQLVATVATPGTKTNTAQVTAHTQTDSDSTPNNGVAAEDDQDDAAVTPLEVDLSLTKSVNDSAPNIGVNVTFTIALANGGPGNATNITVSDTLPAGLSFVSSTPSQGTFDNGAGVWTVGSVANGAAASLQIVATVTTTGTKTNTAQVTAVDQTDTDSTPNNNVSTEDDQDDAVLTPQMADLSVVKYVNDVTPNAGDNVTFTVSLSNAGPNAATNVTVSDALPAGLTFVSSTSSAGSYDNGTGVWTVGTVNNGTTATLQIVATVATVGTKNNTAQVASADQFDPDSTVNNNTGTENDQDDATLTPQQIDLSVTKTVDNASPNLGDNVTFTVTVSNAGPDAATNVLLADALPAGMTFVSSTPSQGSYNSRTGVWTVGTIANGANASLQMTATVTTSGTKTNTAQISAVDQTDTDSTPANDAEAEDDLDVALVRPPLSLSKRDFLAR